MSKEKEILEKKINLWIKKFVNSFWLSILLLSIESKLIVLKLYILDIDCI